MKIKLSLLILIFCSIICRNDGYKILGIFPTMAKSHHIVGSALMKGLAERGHEVTVISPFPLKKPMKNYRDIDVPGVIEKTKFLMNNIVNMHKDGMFESIARIFGMGLFLTELTLQEKSVQNFIKAKNETFDLVIIEVFLGEAYLGFSSVFNAPVVGVSTFGASLWGCDMVGTPSPPSYVPNPFIPLTDHMTYTERLMNFVLITFERLYNDFIYLPKQEALYQKYFPDPKPDFYEKRRNVSLVLLNSHFSVGFPRPYAPNMIEVGGMQINRETRPLPKDIKEFLDSAKDGAIYFSMGSNLKSKILPVEKREAILGAFRNLKQKVLWKWEDKNLPGKSDNILINEWFPQDDILAHPNVKLFITHGGLLSTTESIYHGVPVIGIPMFGDQFLNMARAERAKFGIKVDYYVLTTESLQNAINEVLENPEYANNIKAISQRYRDQPMKPIDYAAYWVEYVIRHKGAPHMHSAGQDLNFIQYHNIDVLATLGGVVFIVFFLLYAMIAKLICRKAKPVTDKKKKKN